MMETNRIQTCKQIGTGLALILSPLAFVVGFGIHPLEGKTAESIFQTVVDNQTRWAAAHVLLLFAAALLIPAAITVMYRLEERRPGYGMIGATLVVVGAVFFGALVGAEALATSAFATVPANQRVGLLPGAQAMLDGKGALWVTDIAFAMLVGLLILGIGLALSGAALRWIGVLTVIAAVIMTVGAFASERIAAIGAVPLLIGFGSLGLEAIRTPASVSREAPVRGDSEIRPAQA